MREREMGRINGVDKAMFGFATRLFMTRPLSSECFDVVVMRNVGGVNICGLRRLKKR